MSDSDNTVIHVEPPKRGRGRPKRLAPPSEEELKRAKETVQRAKKRYLSKGAWGVKIHRLAKEKEVGRVLEEVRAILHLSNELDERFGKFIDELSVDHLIESMNQ